MGVRGLSSYVRNDPRNFSPLILHDTYIVVDGFNLINYLYLHSSLYTQYNGEYLAFDTIVEDFITNLRKCRVEPIFVFDGVHNTSKLSTLLRRNRDRLVTCSQLQKNASSAKDGTSADYRIAMQPPATSLCFFATLTRLNVRQLTTDREADQLAASLAIHLGCPVYLPGVSNQQQARPTGQAASIAASQARNADKFRRLIEWLSDYLDYLFPPAKGNPLDMVSSNSGSGKATCRSLPKTTGSGSQSVGDAALSALTEASQVQEVPLMFNWPRSLVLSFRRRYFAPVLCDSLYSNGYVLGPVVEDYENRQAHHLCAAPIRHLIYGLLLQLEASASSGWPLSHLPGLQGPPTRPYVSEYTRVHASRIEHRRIGITFLSLNPSTPDADARHTFLSEHLSLIENRADTPSWMHGLICLYFLWMRFNKHTYALLPSHTETTAHFAQSLNT
ncbi:unnamed protein product [Dibothriocephalus latus]|uniref:XPG N-terminal domain-containing protein n=1 Tax=Dibothriocephalus latus TaxID=60516 RepID=A0A3P7MP78_DIBLA|nr:unnamed protein product [Dibothriocephalus latus]